MKRGTALSLAILFFMFMTLTGCVKADDNSSNVVITPSKAVDNARITVPAATITTDPNDKVINVLSFTNEAFDILDKYKALHPDFPYQFKYINSGEGAFQPFLDQLLAAGGSDTPDIYFVENSFVLRYTQGDEYQYALPYKDLGIDVDNLLKEADIAKYCVDIGTNPEGALVGLGYQATGAAYIYRRSIAKKVWGTDNPAIIKDKIGPGWDKFFAAAAQLKAKGYGIVSGDGDIWHSIENSSDKPWIVDGKLYIDPKREAFFDYSKKLKENGFDNATQDWTDDWYKDMKGTGKQQILGYFGPAWMISYVLVGNCGGDKIGEGTYGDWAVCEPPVGFFWGGTWVLANKATKKKTAVADIVQWMTLDSSKSGLQYLWANGTIFGPHGVKDAVTSGTVMKKSDGKLDFLRGQNMFEVFYQGGQLANGKNLTRYDGIINNYWRDQVSRYTEGKKTKDQAIADFKQLVKVNLNIETE